MITKLKAGNNKMNYKGDYQTYTQALKRAWMLKQAKKIKRYFIKFNDGSWRLFGK